MIRAKTFQAGHTDSIDWSKRTQEPLLACLLAAHIPPSTLSANTQLCVGEPVSEKEREI